jgi:hypothetical protein
LAQPGRVNPYKKLQSHGAWTIAKSLISSRHEFFFLTKMLQNAPPCACLPVGRGGDECSDFKNPIGRTFLSGNRIFAETACPPVGRESLGYP